MTAVTASANAIAPTSTTRKPSARGSINQESSTTAGIRNTATCAADASAISAASVIFPR